jgi:hypothetical protein
MSAGSRWGPRGVALLILLTVLLVSSGLSGLPSEAAQATAQGGDVRAGRSLTVVGDINQDGIVDTRDYGLWRQRFGQQGAGNPADLNQDSIVDTRDYGLWRQNFGQQGPTPTPTVAATNCIPVGAVCSANVAASFNQFTGTIVRADCANPADPVNCARLVAVANGFTVTGRFGPQGGTFGVDLTIAVVDATTGAAAGTRTIKCPGTGAVCNNTVVSGNVRPQLGGTVVLTTAPVGAPGTTAADELAVGAPDRDPS